MKKVFYAIFLMLATVATTAQAVEDKILEITTDSDPSLLAKMSIEMTHAGLPLAVHYVPDVNENKEMKYSFIEMLKNKVVLLEKTSIPVVTVKLNKLSETTYDFILTYLYKFKLFGSDYRSKRFNASFSAPENRYIIRDVDTQKMISRLHMLTNYGSDGKEVGISKIDTN